MFLSKKIFQRKKRKTLFNSFFSIYEINNYNKPFFQEAIFYKINSINLLKNYG